MTAGYSKCVFVSNTGGTTVGVVGGDGSGSIVGTFSTTLVLRDSAGVATTSFVFGEQIRFDLEARNQSAQAVTLNFPDAQIYDFVVLDSDSARVRWRWSDNMIIHSSRHPAAIRDPTPARPTACCGTAS